MLGPYSRADGESRTGSSDVMSAISAARYVGCLTVLFNTIRPVASCYSYMTENHCLEHKCQMTHSAMISSISILCITPRPLTLCSSVVLSLGSIDNVPQTAVDTLKCQVSDKDLVL